MKTTTTSEPEAATTRSLTESPFTSPISTSVGPTPAAGKERGGVMRKSEQSAWDEPRRALTFRSSIASRLRRRPWVMPGDTDGASPMPGTDATPKAGPYAP
jgi:hypothetical protein